MPPRTLLIIRGLTSKQCLDITTGVCAFVLVWAMVAGAFVL